MHRAKIVFGSEKRYIAIRHDNVFKNPGPLAIDTMRRI